MMNGLQTVGRDGSRTPDFEDPYDTRYETKWEATPIKPFKTQDEYLYAMVEDLAEWLNSLYSLDIGPDNFFEKLETGSVLCQHANNLRRVALEYRQTQHGNSAAAATAVIERDIVINDNDIKYRPDAKEGSFNARDNVSNFIGWCRHSLSIKDVLLFESDDLVMRKNERSFILCLLEVARRGGKVGMAVPLLVQFEQDIEREINAGLLGRALSGGQSEPDSEPSIEPASPTSSAATTDVDRELESGSDADHEMDSQRSESPDLSSLNGAGSGGSGGGSNSNHVAPVAVVPSNAPRRASSGGGSKKSRLPKPLPQRPHLTVSLGSDGYGSTEPELVVEQDPGPPAQIMLEPAVLKSLHERVRELVNECTCPNQFPMVRESEGKYRIGDQSTQIFVRILRNHVMVRIGGGWDTLEHYLDKHDPCKCKLHRAGGRSRTNSFGTSYRKSPKRRISVEGPRLHSRNQSVESLDDVDGLSLRSPSPSPGPGPSLRMRREDSSETIASLDSVQSLPVELPRSAAAHQTPSRPSELGRSNPSRRSLPADRRPSQLPRRLSQTGTTGTEEFLRRRREEFATSSGRPGSSARSAPTSPTRRRPLSSTAIDLSESSVQSDVYRRLALAGGRETGSATQSRRTRSSSMNANEAGCQPRSRDPSQERSIPVSPSMRRKQRSGSLGPPGRRPADRRDKSVIMISRDTGGRHRLDKTGSCDFGDARSQEGSSVVSPTDSEKSATECITERLRERERSRSLSVDRGSSAGRSRIPGFDRGSRVPREVNASPLQRGSKLRASAGAGADRSSRTQIPTFESGSKLRSTTGSMAAASTRPKSTLGVPSRSSRKAEESDDASSVKSTPATTPTGQDSSRFQRAGSLRSARTDRRLFGGSRGSEDALSRSAPRRRTATGRETTGAPRRPVPAELNAENLAKYLQSYQRSSAPRETRSETRSNASSRASSRASSPGASRLRPRIPVPSHLKGEPKTTMRRDSLEHVAQPSRIPLPVQHKKLLVEGSGEAAASARSHSLPDLIANMMDWCQRTINIDNCDARSFTSADSMSPTPSLRTDQDSGYEDNPQKGSPVGLMEEPSYGLRRAARTGSIAEGGEEVPVLAEGGLGESSARH